MRDLLMCGVFAAAQSRLGSFSRTKIPWVGSVGALDMMDFGGRDMVLEKFGDHLPCEHNPQVTLMRTNADKVGVSARDVPAARDAVFRTVVMIFQETANRPRICVPHHITDFEFTEAAVRTLRTITSERRLETTHATP